MIGLDLGTTNCKAVLLDADGRVRAVASDSYKLQIPHPHAAELDVRQVWAAAKKVLRAVAESAPVAPGGICFSGAMHSLFPVADEAGTPISNAMTWADAPAAAVYRSLFADTDTHALYRRTGCPVHSPYHLQRLRWWDRVEPEQVQQAHLWVSIKDWILPALGILGADPLRIARTVEPGPVYTPDPRHHQFYKQHHREYRALRRGMAAMGETLENLKESYA